jgi:hypothetical protein
MLAILTDDILQSQLQSGLELNLDRVVGCRHRDQGLERNGCVSVVLSEITMADDKQPNFMTLEKLNPDGTTALYAVFFEVERLRNRRHRLLLRVQSAYVLDKGLTQRQAKARKVRFETLLRAAYERRKIRQ